MSARAPSRFSSVGLVSLSVAIPLLMGVPMFVEHRAGRELRIGDVVNYKSGASLTISQIESQYLTLTDFTTKRTIRVSRADVTRNERWIPEAYR